MKTALAALLIGCLLPCLLAQAHTEDTVMIQHFFQHQAEFERLVEMDRTDKGAMGFYKATNEKRYGLTDARISQYQRLLNDLKLGGFGGDSQLPFGLHLPFSGTNFFYIITSKGYVWRKEPPNPLLLSLDANLNSYMPKHGGMFTVYRRIVGNWYLYYNKSNDNGL